MNDHYEAIKNKTVCPECGGKDLGFTHMYEATGIVKKKDEVLGLDAYKGLGNLLMITCRTCGCVAKSFLISR